MQKREHQLETSPQDSSAIASRSRKSWTSSSIMALTGSEAVRQSEVFVTTSCYRELLRERKLKKRQSTLDAYIKKKQRFAEDPQPGPSSKM
jgi:hypothetical protein